MEKLFVSYEIAKQLKEKGFDEVCFGFYYYDKILRFFYSSEDKKFIPSYYKNSSNMWKPLFCRKINKNKCYTTPLYQQVIDWFRDKHQIFIDIDIDCTSYPKYCFNISKFIGNPKNLSEKEWYWESVKNEEFFLYRDYYEALDQAIQEALKLI